MDDPYAVLGLTPDASPEEVGAAYRRRAKELHPDIAGGAAAHAAMAQLNAALDAIRAGEVAPRPPDPATPRPPGPRPARGSWLSERIRTALGRELLAALEPHEDVRLVVPASTWQSPSSLLAVTDRRLLWLADDAISERVHQVRHADVESVEDRPPRGPWRRRAVVRVTTRTGRRLTFGDLAPDVAALVSRNVADGRAA